MVKDFNEIKNQLSEEIKQKQLNLDGEKEKFIVVASSFCANWIANYAKKEAIDNKPEITEALDIRLKDFKNEVGTLSKQAPEFIKKELEKKEYWKHYEILENSPPNQYYYSEYHVSGNKEPKILSKGIRLVIGRLGPILERYGYLNPEKNRLDRWEEFGVNYYPFYLEWSPEMKIISENYATKLEDLHKLNYKLKEIIKEERQFKAKQNWDSI